MIFGRSASVESELLRLCAGGDSYACQTLGGSPSYRHVVKGKSGFQNIPIYDTWLGREYHDCAVGYDLPDERSQDFVVALWDKCAGRDLPDEQQKALELPTPDGPVKPYGVPSECKKLTDYLRTRCSSKARRPYYIGLFGLLALAGLGYWAYQKYRS